MSGCECRSGFFALRDCDNPVVGRCTGCRRAICRRHADADGNGARCLDCAARARQDDTSRAARSRTPATDDDDGSVDDGWVYQYRHRFYAGGYAPIYAGSHHGTYYDRYDARSFEHLEVERDDFADDAGAGFGDS